MRSGGFIEGEGRHCYEPDWRPLEKALCSDQLCAYFMWMQDIELEDGTIVNAYKHRWTRRYLHLADGCRAFRYVGEGRYQEVDLTLAIGAAFVEWEGAEPTLEERRALHCALRKTLEAAD